jgi:hypothetical protein
MKTTINGHEVDYSVAEFRELITGEKIARFFSKRVKTATSDKIVLTRKPSVKRHSLANSFKRWTKDEDFLIQTGKKVSSLSAILKRTKKAIHSRKAKLKTRNA